MLIHLLVIGVWFSFTTAGDQVFTELKRISVAESADDGEGRLMRLRTCRDPFMIQCELCEVIRIIKASYAVGQTRYRNSTERCSDFSFHQEFDCLHPTNSRSFEEITGSCNGYQSCEWIRRRAALNCGSLVRTTSCCVEIFYTCEERKGVALSSLFLSNDWVGNVYNASLQCQSSDLSIDSVVLAFNSSGEFHEGGICYKLSTNKKHVAQHCERKGCSGVKVAGESGCGGNSHIHNYGVYIYYTCNSSRLNHCQTTTIRTSTSDAWVSVVVLLVIAVLVSFVVGYIVSTKRKRIAKILSEQQTGATNQKTSFPATRESCGGEVSPMELEGCSYPDISSVIVQRSDLETNQYCEIKDVEKTMKQKSTYPERARYNEASRKTGKVAVRGRLSEGSYGYPKPRKLESKHTYHNSDNRGINPSVVYAQVIRSKNSPTLDYDEVSQSTEASNTMYAGLDFSTQNLKPVYKNGDQTKNYSNPVCRDIEPLRNVVKPVYTNVVPSRRNSKPKYAEVNKTKTKPV